MLQKIELPSGNIYFYCIEYRILFKENNRDHPVQTKWFSDEDLKSFYRQTDILHNQNKNNQQ